MYLAMQSEISALFLFFVQRDGVVVRAFASQSVDLRFIPLVELYQNTLKMMSIAFLLGSRHLRDVVEYKPASSLVVSLARHLTGCCHLYAEDKWPDTSEMATPKQVRTSNQKDRDTIRFLVRG